MEKDNQISEPVNVSDKGDILVSLVKDNLALRLCSRSVKISKAVSLVTAHIEDNRELKGKLRATVLDMSDMAISTLVGEPESLIKDSKVVLSRGVALLNFVEIAQSLNLISNTNGTIILEQIKSFLSDFNAFVGNKNSDEVKLADSFFELPSPEVEEESRVLNTATITKMEQGVAEVKPAKPFIEKLATANHKAHADSRVTRSSFHPTSAEFRQRLATAKTIEDLHGIKTSGSNAEQGKSTVGVKNDRQELIISTIGQKGELSIKDLEGVIKGCSEKTIQRELLSLVEQGILVKSGERRWSRYALAHA